MTALLLLCATLGVHESALAPLNGATGVRGYTRGIDGVGVDPASVAATDGFALQYRHRIVREDGGFGRIGGFAALPVSRLVFSGGYEWYQIPGARFERGTFGLAAVIEERLWAGISVNALSSKHHQLDGLIWSAGLYSELFSWLTLSAGIDGFNRPQLLGGDIRPDYVFGASVRPLLGEPWLTLGTEVRISAGGLPDYDVYFNRAIVDVAPIDGLHILAAYERTADNLPEASRLTQLDTHQLWFGLSFALGSLEASVAALGYREGDDPSDSDVFADTQLGLTLRLRPSETVIAPSGRVVEVALYEGLKSETGFLDPGSPIATLPYQLDRLADDPSVGTVLLRLGELDVELATVDEVRAAVKRLRGAGKIVVADIATADDKVYMIAAACNHIRVDPLSTLFVDGFAVAMRYYADTLAKVGIKFHAVGIGRYKTGPDALTRAEPRPEEIEMRDEILDEAYQTLMTALTVDRGLSRERADAILEKGIFTSAEAVEMGLADDYTSSTDPHEVPPYTVPGEELDEREPPSRLWGQRPVISVIPIVGVIAISASDNPLPGATAQAGDVIAAIDEAAADGDVDAVVLRIDSPGGDVLAADLIWRAVRRLREVKPVVVSMGDVAASGGYYVAAPAHTIFAERNTITGSIGIYALRPDVTGLFDMLGINSQIEKKGRHADWQMWSRAPTDEDRERAEQNLRAYYDIFVGKVAAGRGMEVDAVAAIAEGRVYTGARALDLHLVDRIGGLADAVREARRLAGIEPDEEVIVDLPKHPRTITRIVKNLVGLASAEQPGLEALWDDLLTRVRGWDGRVLALLPVYYDFDR